MRVYDAGKNHTRQMESVEEYHSMSKLENRGHLSPHLR